MVETWEMMKFSVLRYFKGTQERGSILGPVEEVLQCLDDNSMNLQSMAGSRYVGPFLSTVQQWEKHLSLMGEVIEVGHSTARGQCSQVEGAPTDPTPVQKLGHLDERSVYY